MQMQLVNEGKKYFEELEMEQVNGREKKKEILNTLLRSPGQQRVFH